jgi:imidazole glycerol-phosphate synthase subunit HisF
MLRPRIIPCLLVHEKGLVKTVKFKAGKYVGDPINAVKIFNEKEVDELIVLDIDATRTGAGPDYTLIQRLAAECRMPLAYGGGVRSADDARRIIGLGVEKVALSAAVVANPALIRTIAHEVGKQSVVVVLDARRKSFGERWELVTQNATVATGMCPIEFAREAQQQGAGEIVINSVDRDGAMSGYDLKLVERVRNATNVPLTVLGGAGSIADIEDLVARFGVLGAAAGSLFVFKGPYKAVLINYPDQAQRDRIAARAVVGQGAQRP